ncbi:MAG: alkaline phosphatase D [Verrucomicrobia bacterium]|jgi:alkaline phosphatase D|nr:MAG: alkaline phosphatase D [Verrucomicrobiota bacterium]
MSEDSPRQIPCWTCFPQIQVRRAIAATVPPLAVIAGILATPPPASAISPSDPLERIAFGSCCNQKRSQVIWPAIAALRPQLFLFLGDNIYGDSEDMNVLRAKYDELNANPGYAALRAICPVLATWDDHDYGANDAGAEFSQRDPSQKLFLKAFNIPKDRGPWQRPGVYDAYSFGPKGRRVQIILLDTRYFRGPLLKFGPGQSRKLGPYQENPNPSSSMLGEAQWRWLEAQLKEPADLRLIGSSIQVLPVDSNWERWQNLPHERAKLLDLLRQTPGEPIVLLSGDRHLGELMRYEISPGRFLHEATSSGLSHAGGGQESEPNRFRTGLMFRELNFGTLEIDWSGPKPRCTLAIRDVSGKVVRTVTTADQ